MTLWRCPHCGTPQPVAARCWVCRRSSTSCGTCRHFRASVAARIGYCGLDRTRAPLAGSEIRTCWDGVALADIDDAQPAPEVLATLIDAPRYVRGFVPVEDLLGTPATLPSPAAIAPSAAPSVPPPPIPAAAPPPSDGLLWADLET